MTGVMKRVLVVASFSALPAFGQERPGIAVFDLTPTGATKLEVEATSNAVARGLRELDAFAIVSTDDLRQLLSVERQKALLGLDDSSETRASMGALGVRHAVVGSVTRAAGKLSVELRLLDTQDSKVISQKSLPGQAGLETLLTAVGGLAQELVGPLLAAERGHLAVICAEEAAEVLVDDVSRGSTPLPAPIALPRGKHRVSVKKDGFIARLSVVTVEKGQTAVENVTLLPSPDFADAYKSRNTKVRVGAWVATATAVAAFGAALVVDRFVAEPKFQNEFLPRQRALDAYSRAGSTLDPASLSTPVERACASAPDACRTEAGTLKAQLSTMQIVTWALLGTGVAATGIATYLWVSGDDPGRYAHLVASVGPTGGSFGVAGAF